MTPTELMIWRLNGLYYVRRWGFSLNEGCFPNIHMSWRKRPGGFLFYVALGPKWKWWWPR